MHCQLWNNCVSPLFRRNILVLDQMFYSVINSLDISIVANDSFMQHKVRENFSMVWLTKYSFGFTSAIRKSIIQRELTDTSANKVSFCLSLMPSFSPINVIKTIFRLKLSKTLWWWQFECGEKWMPDSIKDLVGI